jgi:small-conductance mechanosensitive channel
VTNHRRLYDPFICTLQIKIDHRVLPAQVIDVLESAAADCPNLAAGAKPLALADSFSEGLINYELSFAVEDYLQNAAAQSAVINRIVARFKELSIQIGAEALDIRLIRSAAAVAELTAGKAMNDPPKV